MLKNDQRRKGLIFEILLHLLWQLINSINISIEEEEGVATFMVMVMEEVTAMVNLLNFLLVNPSSLSNPTMVKVSFPLHSLNPSLIFNKVKRQFARSVVRMVILLWTITIK